MGFHGRFMDSVECGKYSTTISDLDSVAWLIMETAMRWSLAWTPLMLTMTSPALRPACAATVNMAERVYEQRDRRQSCVNGDTLASHSLQGQRTVTADAMVDTDALNLWCIRQGDADVPVTDSTIDDDRTRHSHGFGWLF